MRKGSWSIQKAKDESCEYLPSVNLKEDMKPYNSIPMANHKTPTRERKEYFRGGPSYPFWVHWK